MKSNCISKILKLSLLIFILFGGTAQALATTEVGDEKPAASQQSEEAGATVNRLREKYFEDAACTRLKGDYHKLQSYF